jgi:hypothetical protein
MTEEHMITPRDFEEMNQQQMDDLYATSPWTEPFQRSYADAQAAQQDQKAQRPAKAEIDPLTHDALSAIFNGD